LDRAQKELRRKEGKLSNSARQQAENNLLSARDKIEKARQDLKMRRSDYRGPISSLQQADSIAKQSRHLVGQASMLGIEIDISIGQEGEDRRRNEDGGASPPGMPKVDASGKLNPKSETLNPK
jgi:hypothetical protein